MQESRSGEFPSRHPSLYGDTDCGLCPLFITSNTILSHLSVNFIFQRDLTILNAILSGTHKSARDVLPSVNFSCEQPSPGLALAPGSSLRGAFESPCELQL